MKNEKMLSLIRAQLGAYDIEETLARINSYGESGPSVAEYLQCSIVSKSFVFLSYDLRFCSAADFYGSDFFDSLDANRKTSVAVVAGNDDNYYADLSGVNDQYGMAA